MSKSENNIYLPDLGKEIEWIRRGQLVIIEARLADCMTCEYSLEDGLYFRCDLGPSLIGERRWVSVSLPTDPSEKQLEETLETLASFALDL